MGPKYDWRSPDWATRLNASSEPCRSFSPVAFAGGSGRNAIAHRCLSFSCPRRFSHLRRCPPMTSSTTSTTSRTAADCGQARYRIAAPGVSKIMEDA